MEAKIEWKLTWQCCNPEKGRVDFEDGWLIKSSFKRMKFEDCQLNRTKFPAKNNICNCSYHHVQFFECFFQKAVYYIGLYLITIYDEV
jgi:hypothetical protein